MRVSAWLATVLVGVCPLPASAQYSEPLGQPASPPRLAPPYIGPEVSGGVLARVSSSSNYDDEQPFGAAYGAGLWYAPSERLSFGAHYEYVGLGSGESSTGTDYVEASYAAHTVWAAGRVYPYLGDGHSIFVGLGVGLVYMHQDAVGVRTSDVTDPAGTPFKCGHTSSPDVGFRVSTGLSVDIGERLEFVSSVWSSMLRGSSDVVDGCVPGIGSPITVGVGMGFAYHFGL